MMALIRKDWRQNQVAIVGSAVMLGFIYLLAIYSILFQTNPDRPRDVPEIIIGFSLAGFWITALMGAVYGGTAFALERRERSADFLAMLPTTKTRIILSKLIVAAACLLLMWLINFMVMLSVSRTYIPFKGWTNVDEIIAMTTAGAVMTFGVGWLFSSLLTSPAIAASISIGASPVILILTCLFVAPWYRPDTFSDELAYCYAAWCGLFVGVICLVAGTVCYLWRVEP